MSGIEYRKNLPIKVETDVFIAGGGPAGVAAAVSCAKMGAKVFLAEASGAFGGMGTLGLVPELMNFDDGEHFLAEGFGRKIHKTLFGEEKDYYGFCGRNHDNAWLFGGEFLFYRTCK